jgi:hypothetical protein
MATNDDIQDLMKQYFTIENEIRLLREDKKELFERFKNRIDPKAFKAALQVAKIQARLKPNEKTDYEVAYQVLESELNLEHID